jgi:hypothetical protein
VRVAGGKLQPVSVGSDGKLTQEAAVTLDDTPTHMAAGGGALYLGYASGRVEAWSVPAASAPSRLGSIEIGGETRGLVTNGSKVIALAMDTGMNVVSFDDPAKPQIVQRNKDLSDPKRVRLFGRMLVVELERGWVSAVDVSRADAPRAVTTNKDQKPGWVGIVDGNLVYGSDKQLTVAAIPPALAGRITDAIKSEFPVYGSLPVRFSKRIDDKSAESVELRCAGAKVAGRVVLTDDRMGLSFRADADLPTGAACELDLSKVRDRVGLELSASGDEGRRVSIKTAPAKTQPIINPASKYKHTDTDGRFTDWSGSGEFEWFDVKSAKGMFTRFYADFDGSRLYILNDWIYSDEKISPGGTGGTGGATGGTGGTGGTVVNCMTFPTEKFNLAGPYSGPLVTGDFKKDARPDIIAAISGNGNAKVLLGAPPMTAAADLSINAPNGVFVGDFNGDNQEDLLGVHGGGANVFLGTGTGTFGAAKPVTVSEPTGAALGEYSGDGKLDVVWASFGNAMLSLGNGDGTLGAATAIQGLAIGVNQVLPGDFNGDGKADFVVLGTGPTGWEVWVMIGTGSGTFSKQAGSGVTTSGRATVVDFDGDGKLDILVANTNNNSVSLVYGNGNGTFQAKVDVATGPKPVWAAAGKINGDTMKDLVVAGDNGVSVNFMVQLPAGFALPVDYAIGGKGKRVLVTNVDLKKNDDIVVTLDGPTAAQVGTVQFLYGACP